MNFHLRTSSTTVEAWAAQRLPYEPKGWKWEFRDALREALKRLEADPDLILEAVYSSDSTDFCDAENVVFYNVGAGAYSHLVRTGLRFERWQTRPPTCPVQLDATHYHGYRLVEAESESSFWSVGEAAASWSFQVESLHGERKPHEFWGAMRRGDVHSDHALAGGC